MERTDIPHSDVFFSWTSADRDIKNKIVAFLRNQGISCTESDHACSGDFHQWSREAVSRSTVFLLLYTENTLSSQFVPVEIDAFMKLEDRQNRCVPVVTDFALYKSALPDLGDRESAVILDNRMLTDDHLNQILEKVRSLICHRLFSIYRSATAPAYLRFESLLRELRMATEFQHEKLYINRSVTDERGQAISDAAVFCKSRNIIYLNGPAGSGKTCYIDQLRNAAGEDTLVLSLHCRKLLNTHSIFDELYAEFCRYCGNRHFYSPANFKSLLSAKHLLLVLDGLDEIGTQKGKETLFSTTRDYYVTNAASTTLFITSRSTADADMWKMNGQAPRIMRLNSLEEDQIKDFGSKLFLLFGFPDKGADFYTAIHDLSEEIRANPLLLSQLAIVYNAKNEIPQTIVGIYDAVCEIMVNNIKRSNTTPADFDNGILVRLSSILKHFSAERYRLLSQGKAKTTEQIFKKTLRDYACNPDDAPALIRFLQDRAIMAGNEFYHKMLLEYFTAVYYYEQCFDDYDELENRDVLTNLFSHYNDPYWSAVLQMFLAKADSRTDAETTEALYHALMTFNITDFTLLFNTCRDLPCHKETARTALLKDILERSSTGAYPPYGPLFWYVPEYDLYFDLLGALASLQESPCFSKALALTRDVCWIFGKYHTAEAVNNSINGRALLAKANLSSIRKGLCELFYQGETEFTGGRDVYPRCFNLAEAEKWKEEGIGIYGRMGTAFEDELGLYSHEMLRPFGGEWVGIVSMGYDVAWIEETLSVLSCRKFCGLFLSSTRDAQLQRMAINDRHLRVVYLPENIQPGDFGYYDLPRSGEGTFVGWNGVMYFRETMNFPADICGIKSYSFSQCSTLASITIPNSVTWIGSSAFSGCSSLTSIEIPYSVHKIDWSAFSDCISLTSVSIQYGITKISGDVFSGCSALTSVEIPYSVLEIGESAFSGCSSLTSIEIPYGVFEIGESAFSGCSALSSIELPESVYKIDDLAFSGCSSLTSIKLPDGLYKIGKGVFRGCTALKYIANCPTFCNREYLGVSDACIIEYRETEKRKVEFRSKTEIFREEFCDRLDITCISIPDGVKRIGHSAFRNCASLSSVTIPESVTEIEVAAFSDCSSLTAITIPDCVTRIEKEAFSGCSSLSSIKLPDRLHHIGKGVFRGCTALNCISNCPTFCNRKYLGVSDACIIEYREIKGRKIEFRSKTEIKPCEFCYRDDITCISIPHGVKNIGWCAFSGCSSLTSVTIPESVEGIYLGAFSGCSSLSAINIPKSVIKLTSETFKDCSSLTSITIPEGIEEIGWETFSGCSSLSSVTIPDSVTKIGYCAFLGCSSLSSITIPEGIEEIAYQTFFGCSSLAYVTIPNGVTTISVDAFSGCSSLTSVTIPNGVTLIGSDAFSGCSSLTSIVIPKTVRFLRDEAFAGCTGLREITLSHRFEDNLPRIFKNVDLSEVKITWH